MFLLFTFPPLYSHPCGTERYSFGCVVLLFFGQLFFLFLSTLIYFGYSIVSDPNKIPLLLFACVCVSHICLSIIGAAMSPSYFWSILHALSAISLHISLCWVFFFILMLHPFSYFSLSWVFAILAISLHIFFLVLGFSVVSCYIPSHIFP